MPQLWERQPDEPNLWYDRFHRYMLMGADRSMRRLYELDKGHKCKALPGAWRKAAQDWRWKVRAEAWDRQNTVIDEADFEAQREKARELRGEIIFSALSLIMKAQDAEEAKTTPDLEALKKLMEALKIVFNEVRIEYGDPALQASGITIHNSNNNSAAAQIAKPPTLEELGVSEEQKIEAIKHVARELGMVDGNDQDLPSLALLRLKARPSPDHQLVPPQASPTHPDEPTPLENDLDWLAEQEKRQRNQDNERIKGIRNN